VVFATCDAGCPVDGSRSQDLHNLLGLITYFAAGLAFVLLSFAPGLTGRARKWRRVLWAAGVVWVVLFVLMLEPELAAWRGLVQRIADVMLAGVLVLVAWGLIPGARHA
jgi:EamA domain-containing membrane protein RarD